MGPLSEPRCHVLWRVVTFILAVKRLNDTSPPIEVAATLDLSFPHPEASFPITLLCKPSPGLVSGRAAVPLQLFSEINYLTFRKLDGKLRTRTGFRIRTVQNHKALDLHAAMCLSKSMAIFTSVTL